MEVISVCLIEKNYLVREGLKNLLDETNFKIIKTHQNVYEDDGGKDSNEQNAALVICGIDETEKNPEKLISTVKKYHPFSRIAVLSPSIEFEFFTLCFSEEVDGYLSTNLSQASLLNALGMIMSGEKVYPAAALDLLLKEKNNSARASSHALSDREIEILKHVANGKTNKEIALFHDISESTVKAHVKTILRKLNLSNRTQAARWAFGSGLTGE